MGVIEAKDTDKGFRDIFLSVLNDLEQRAHRCGITMTDMCRMSGVARATPDRWRKKLPKTVQNVIDLEIVVRKAEESYAQTLASSKRG